MHTRCVRMRACHSHWRRVGGGAVCVLEAPLREVEVGRAMCRARIVHIERVCSGQAVGYLGYSSEP